jgi:hypothetical protein
MHLPAPFIGLAPDEIRSRVTAIASAAAGFAVVVHVGEEGNQHRNIAVDLPHGKTKGAGALLRRRVTWALGEAHVPMAVHALAPPVWGTLRGHVQVAETTRTGVMRNC